MLPDTLDQKTDVELDQLFAVKLAGWATTICTSDQPFERNGYRLPNTFSKGVTMTAWWHPSDPNNTGAYVAPPKFSTRADLVLPWLEKSELFPLIARPWNVGMQQRAYEVAFDIGIGGGRWTGRRTVALTLARALAIALLREQPAK